MHDMSKGRPSAKSFALSLLTVTVLAGGFALPACSAQGGGAAEAQPDVLAKVNGKEITKAEVLDAAKQQLESAEAQLKQAQKSYEQQKFDILDKTVHKLVEDQLIDAEAAKRGMSKDDLMAAEVDAKVEAVTDADVDKFYEENKARIPVPKEQVAERIKTFLSQQRKQEAHEAFVKSLQTGAQVAYFLDPPRVKVDATGPVRGGDSAPVTIVEFSDFECPFCGRVVPTLEQLREKYGDKIKLVYRQFPLPMHPHAEKAAEASLCAEEQGKFWEMHDAMFADQKGLDVDGLKAKAQKIGLDVDKFDACLSSNKYAEHIQNDIKYGRELGVSGTPSMFINGRFVSGAQPLEQFTEIIDDELARHDQMSMKN